MKKKVLMTILVLSLLTSGSIGGAYAAISHEPVNGEKLIGYGPLGTKGDGPYLKDSCHFTFTKIISDAG